MSTCPGNLVVEDRLTTSTGTMTLAPTGPSGDNGKGSLDPDETRSYQATSQVTAGDIAAWGTLVNVATARADGPRPVLLVQSAEVPVTMPSPGVADLTLETLAGVETAMVGDLVPYTIQISNAAAASAVNTFTKDGSGPRRITRPGLPNLRW
ncbi:hypothetical protein HOY34_05050 [Xinfangfangia sp. D13-10-4-6]|uniref:hypothetical protein n=1 Tax=Pseudogemmobacter hezensis TaxID=2737662 RepID=UPI001553DE9C|nr:hypothetical protein [Pseudogemmobacter hezensis]NPD14569.1 hypothetical protein [Pseudogemmobacter hezensis]